jgi:hypothetical protein
MLYVAGQRKIACRAAWRKFADWRVRMKTVMTMMRPDE